MKVASHVEKLAMSACKRASGDALWCGSCHHPHSLESAALDVAKISPAEQARAVLRQFLELNSDSSAARAIGISSLIWASLIWAASQGRAIY